MLCPSCRRQLSKGATYCGSCGAPLAGGTAPLELVLADRTRVPIVDSLTIGRAPGNTLQIADPSVSRTHAHVWAHDDSAPMLEDAGSSHGTFLDGRRLDGSAPLRDGAKIQIGDADLRVERRRQHAEAGRTIVVRPGATLMLSGGHAQQTANATQFGMRPRVRSGYALKRLEESEGTQRWVLRDLRTNKYRRMDDTEAVLFELFDGRHSLADLIGFAERAIGSEGPARLARLLSDLGERGFLVGVDADDEKEAPRGRLRRMIGPHEKEVRGLDTLFERAYRRGGWLFFLRPVQIALAVLMVVGIGVFVALMIGRYGTPFVVARKIGVGGLIFLAGRFAFVALHELAHGMAMASYGRRVGRSGLKAVFVIPYVFVDTSEAWFEPRRRRMGIAAAGPVSDLSLGALFAILCLALEPGTIRDIFFNLAFAAYVGAIFNLNPFLDRDGYHIMLDVLREPQLRRRAKEQFNRVLSGRGRGDESPVMLRYGAASVAWLGLMGGFAVFMSLHYSPAMKAVAPDSAVDGVLVTFWVCVFVPVVYVLGRPLFERLRHRRRAPELV